MTKEKMRWQWHQLNHMQITCTLLQTDNHTSTSSLNFLQAGCSSWCPTNSVKALKAKLLPTLNNYHTKFCGQVFNTNVAFGINSFDKTNCSFKKVENFSQNDFKL